MKWVFARGGGFAIIGVVRAAVAEINFAPNPHKNL